MIENSAGQDLADRHRADRYIVDWEAIVLDRVRARVALADDAGADVDAGWESVALERLRAHYDSEG